MSATPLRAIVGLGNPGPEYARTRHNAGFWLVDRLAQRHGAHWRTESRFHGELARAAIGGHDVLLLKPATFMNRSGQAIHALLQFYKLQPADILVVHDELDLPAGTARLKAAGGHGGHNGLRDVHKHVGEAYLRLRIGIGHPGHRDQVLDYVLHRPGKGDEALMLQAIEAAESAVETWMSGGWDKAVKQLHSSADGRRETPGSRSPNAA